VALLPFLLEDTTTASLSYVFVRREALLRVAARGSRKDSNLSEEHLAALAKGREQAAAVKAYIEALEASKAPRKVRGKRTPEYLQRRLDEIADEYPNGDAMKRLALVSEQLRIEEELEEIEAEGNPPDPTEFEKGFITHAAAYAEAKKIVYGAWRHMGVSPAVLRDAGHVRHVDMVETSGEEMPMSTLADAVVRETHRFRR
jgi:hypothetical protein